MSSTTIPTHWGSAPGDEFYTIQILKDDTFKGYEGFDLGNFDDKDSRSNALTFYVPKVESYGDFKRAIARLGNGPGEQVRLWVCYIRTDGTIRPFEPFDKHKVADSAPMTEIIFRHLRATPLKLYLEFTKNARPPGGNFSLVFLKHFDIPGQRIYGIGSIYVSDSRKVSTLCKTINKLMEWQPPRKLLLYEEVKPDRIDTLDPKKSFTENEIEDGDIICFQEAPNKTEMQILRTRYPDFVLNVVQFYAKMRSNPQGIAPPKLPKQTIDFVVLPGQSFEDALKHVQERMGVKNKDLTGYKFTCSNKTDSDAASANFSSLMTCTICLELLVDPVSFMDCMHVACGACAVEWFGYSNICHQCRQPVRAVHDIHAIAAMVEAYCQFNCLASRSDTELANLRDKYKPGQLIEISQPEEAEVDSVVEERPFSTAGCHCCNPDNELDFLCPDPILYDNTTTMFPGHTRCADCNAHLPLIPEFSSECCAICTRLTCRELGLECGDSHHTAPFSIQRLKYIRFPKKLDTNLFEAIPIEYERDVLLQYARDRNIGTQELFNILLEHHGEVGFPRASWHGVGRAPFNQDFVAPTDLVCVTCARDLVAGSLLSWGQSALSSLSPDRPSCEFGIACCQALVDMAHAHEYSHICTPTGNNHPQRLRDDAGAQEDGNRLVCNHTELGDQGGYSFSFDPEEVEFKRDGEASFLCSVVIRSELQGYVQQSTLPGSTIIKQGEAVAVYLEGFSEQEHSGAIRVLLDTRHTKWVRTSGGYIPLGCRPVLGGIDRRSDEEGQELYHCAAWLGGVRSPGYISRRMKYACIAHPSYGECWQISDDYELLCWN